MGTTIRGWNALVTGATFGLGPFIARALAREGVNVAVASRSTERLNSVARELRTMGVRSVALPTDLRNDDARKMLVDRATQELGNIDILVNTAAVLHAGRFHKRTPEEFQELIEVNLLTPILLTRLLIPGMLARRRGHIVQVASLAGKVGTPYLTPYAASKSGLVGFAHALRGELTGTGVHVSVVCPGFMTGEGMWGRANRRVHPFFGTSKPERVARAVVTAIRRRQVEVIVNPLPVRYAIAAWALAPRLGAAMFRWAGVNTFLRGFALQAEAEAEADRTTQRAP